MAELIPAHFGDLVARLFCEPAAQGALFELPRRSWYVPASGAPDMTVRFHGGRAGNPAGPAAGPHTQMAQNLLLSYVAGGRILELKTVQVNDQLKIGRPCIDVTNVGYNIEWSQELRVEQSLREYVAGSMLVEIFRRGLAPGVLDDAGVATMTGTAGDVIYDISVGYDLAGIRSEEVRRFLEGMRDATAIVAELRGEIPGRFRGARDHEYPVRLSNSITLSTFHGCPADEIEAICEFLVGELDFDVIVKMNPPTLGREKVEHLLHDVLGYTSLCVNPKAYQNVISFGDSVSLCERLTGFAGKRGRRLGFKFSNTLEVVNHRAFFTRDNEIMYLSGQPLHVITMALTDEFRRAVGPEAPISFSAGVDQHNFPLATACGFVPITVSTDLLRPGGYGRLPAYLHALAREMTLRGATNIDAYIVRFAREHGFGGAAGGENGETKLAAAHNTSVAAGMARNEPRYRAARNAQTPKRIDSHLRTFDCITCDKCLPVCPNAANFKYRTPVVSFEFRDFIVSPEGSWRESPESRVFEIERAMQIACYADFCNECGNCDTFCPEYGGPYIEKPSFFGSVESWERALPRDGFVVGRSGDGGGDDGQSAAAGWIRGRIKGVCYALHMDGGAEVRFEDDVASVVVSVSGHRIVRLRLIERIEQDHRLDMWIYHVLRHLYSGLAERQRLNQVNAGWVG